LKGVLGQPVMKGFINNRIHRNVNGVSDENSR
jgi:hypothetical protein